MRPIIKLLSVILFIVSCADPVAPATGNDIVLFSVDEQVGVSVIDAENATVYATVDSAANQTALFPHIEISENATIDPPSDVVTDFSKGAVNYIVTSESNEKKNWKVLVEKKKSNDADIISFAVKRQIGETIFNDTTVTVEVRSGFNVASLSPDITVSPKATISPASKDDVDFSNGPVIYTVTAENGRQQEWVVTVTEEKIYEANILTFNVPDQVGESVFENNTITMEVPVGSDYTQVVPTITITENTSINPASGEAVDFSLTGYVDYTVTSEIGHAKIWRVYLSEVLIKANNPKIQYMGRVDFENPLKPRLHAPGAAISLKFKGTFCDIVLRGNFQNYLQIIIDGVNTRIQTEGKYIVKDLSDGEHTLTIVKDTEANIGYIEFIGIRCTEILDPDPLPEKRIEFIGNSITCGSGIDDSQIACETGEWYDQHSAYQAYGPIAARELNAQWMLSSFSGIGMIHSCCGMTKVISDIYEQVDLSASGKVWDFSKYQADIVTICLGQNDGIQDSVAFCSAYVDFIETVQSKYNNPEIICLTSPMADDGLYTIQMNYLTGIVEHLNDDKVKALFLSHKLNSGCQSHPNAVEHQTIAEELVGFIRSNSDHF
jgi:hypothetical protein